MGDELTLLLHKELTGEITPAESERLQAILQQSPDATKMAAALRAVWDDAAAWQYPESVDLEHDFGQVLQRIHLDEQHNRPTKVALRATIWWRAVAAVFVLAVAIFSFQQWQNAADTARLLPPIHAQDDRQIVSLPDGSKTWLRKGTTITLTKDWANAPYREITLDGYAYFEVEHQPEHPFRIHLLNGEMVEVLGTKFSVNSQENLNSSSVLVTSGSVRFLPDKQQQGPILSKGQKAIFDRQQSKILISTPASMNELAWQTGGLEFIETPLYQVVSDLQDFYQVKITLSDPAMRNCRYTSPLTTRQPIEQVLQSLVWSFKFDLQKTGSNQYLLEKGQCR